MPKGILRCQLGNCLDIQTKRLFKVLEDTARQCNIARNGMMRYIVNWMHDQPSDEERKDFMKKLSTKPYSFGRQLAPEVASMIVSCLHQECNAMLKANVPYNHDGTARWRWQAIQRYELQPPSFRGYSVPLHNRTIVLCYLGETSKPTGKRLVELGQSSCVIQFTLLSKESGFFTKRPTCRIEARQLSRGNRRLLQRMARREVRIADSKLVLDKKGKWAINIVYEVDRDMQLNPENILYLQPNADKNYKPFRVIYPDGGHNLGYGLALKEEYTRVHMRRKAIAAKYRDGVGSGHGRSRFFRATRPIAHTFTNTQRRFEKLLVSDIIKACQRYDCGTVIYRQPSKPARDKTWFSEAGIPFNWSRLEANLKWKCEVFHIGYSTEVWRMKQQREVNDQWAERYAKKEKAGT